jgi:phage anti-repressor protein
MKKLIALNKSEINGSEIQTVNARELHAFLESKQEFRHWIKNRIDQYGFVENQDFITSENFIRGGTAIDYHLTFDMAKELAMVERNEKGKQARQYFIKCEKEALGLLSGTKKVNPKLPTREQMDGLFSFYDNVIKVPGIQPGIAMAQTLSVIQANTGLNVEPMRLALPAKTESKATLNATKIGKIKGISAREVNKKIENLGMSVRNNGNIELTEYGKSYGEAIPYSKNGHAGYQILWRESLVDLL